MTDDDFLAAFESCHLPQEAWTHEAHIRMAWLYLHRGPLVDMLATIRQGIRCYNAAHGKAPAYHETITHAYVLLVHDRLQGADVESFADFCRRNPDLLDRKLSALDPHYRRETLFSPAARIGFLAPDLAPLPGVNLICRDTPF